jgi:hypothetical protein
MQHHVYLAENACDAMADRFLGCRDSIFVAGDLLRLGI